jgi:hypothetical protein
VVVGSFGRLEASKESDLDYFALNPSREKIPQEPLEIADEVVRRMKFRLPAKDGHFRANQVFDEMLVQIGGDQDTNTNLSRRMLLFTESRHLFNEDGYDIYISRLLGRYIQRHATKNKPPLFLLNDLIRFYRTMLVDFDYKTRSEGKAWGLRNVKLTFSRKMLYFGGLVAIAESFEYPRSDKIRIISELLKLAPAARIESIFGVAGEKALALYDEFLGRISSQSIRSGLEKVTSENRRDSAAFSELKDLGQEFSIELVGLLRGKYGPEHQIFVNLIV